MELRKRKLFITYIISAVFFVIGFRFGVHDPLLQTYIKENQYKIDILNYNINIDIYPEEKSIIGDVELTGIFTDINITQLDLNFYDNFKIEGVWYNGESTPYTNVKTQLSIPLKTAGLDTFKVRIKYSGKPVRAGLSAFAFGTINKKSVVYTINEPTFASTWFPCNDIPSDKALLQMSITNSSGQTSVSNGKFVSATENNGRKTFNWKTIYPISTYLISVYSAEYENFRDIYTSRDGKTRMNIEYFAFPQHVEQAKIDFLDHPKILEFFSETFGEYPFIEEKYGVAEFLWQLGAMENQTITGIGSNFINGRKFFTDIYVHELAHSWWGNAVGPQTWNDIWLNEGFATYSEALYFEHTAGKEALISTMMSKFDESFAGRLYDPGSDLFNNTIYSKGAWVMHMLRWETGDSLFFNILKEYYNQYKYKTASTRDFQTLVETLSGRDFTWFFNQWVFEGEDQINLNYQWDYDEKNKTVNLKTKQVQEKYSNYIFSLETEINYGDSTEIKVLRVDNKENFFTIPVYKQPDEVKLDPRNWLLANFREKSF